MIWPIVIFEAIKLLLKQHQGGEDKVICHFCRFIFEDFYHSNKGFFFPDQFITFVPMQVNDALVENLANLARLKFNEEEKAAIQSDLQKMISFVEKLDELDTTGVEPLLHMSDITDNYREDEIRGSVSRELGLKNAPDTDGVYFKVPQVIKK